MNVVRVLPYCVYCISSLYFYVWVSVQHKSILYKEPTRCNFGAIVY